MSRISYRIREDLNERLGALARELDRSRESLINEAIEVYLEQEDRRRKRHRETLEGLTDVEAGRLVDGDEVLAWIESWSSGKRSPQPDR